jgi:hypothetical protein
MRYTNVETITFTDIDGKSTAVKDMRLLPAQTIVKTISVIGSIELDEIASRKDIYGDGGENLSYKIFEANLLEIVERRFDLSRIRSLKIPA